MQSNEHYLNNFLTYHVTGQECDADGRYACWTSS